MNLFLSFITLLGFLCSALANQAGVGFYGTPGLETVPQTDVYVEYEPNNGVEYSQELKESAKDTAKYSYNYGVSDPNTGDHKKVWEIRDGNSVRPSYVLPQAQEFPSYALHPASPVYSGAAELPVRIPINNYYNPYVNQRTYAAMDTADFQQKRKNLFDCLDQAEKSLNSDSSLVQRSTITLDELVPERTQESDNKRRKTVIKSHSSRKESIFKRPELPIQRCMPMRHVPDYKVNPHKWKKYSLEDADCSDRTNTAAAFNFLREIEKRKEIDEKEEGSSDSVPSKIVFKKSVKLNKVNEESSEESSSVLRGTKVVMPEYVVGQKRPSKVERKLKSDRKSEKHKELKLNHLMEDEEEEDDGT
uniref:U5 small nuclear ribonucleoprotein TSSC4 n=1 Tax=Culicoides sonorensis TaxID=179676 RepID=A0A336MXT5_CULSO